MTRRRFRGVAAALAAVVTGAALAACGVPAGTGVRVDGPMPEAGSPDEGGPAVPPPGPDEAENELQLVDDFLQVAAGAPDNPVELLREFIHVDQREAWEPDPQILVVRTIDEALLTPTDPARVEMTVQQVGVLTEFGVIQPQEGEPREVTFRVSAESEVGTAQGDRGLDVGEPRFRLVDPLPDKIMLSESALDEEEPRYLVPRPLYFWAGDGDVLVPDLRWLPSALSDRQRAQRMLEWLQEGPSPWLRDAVKGLDDGVALTGNAVWSEDRLDVPLTAAAADVDPTRLNAQLWWTLHPYLAGDRSLVLAFDGQERVVDQDYLAQNAAARPAPASFAVLNGVIHQQKTAGKELELQALSGDVNADIHSAALTRDAGRAALVRVEPNGRHRLVISRPAGVVETQLVSEDMRRPVWLLSGRVGLVVAGGRLHRFTSDGETSPVTVSSGALDRISAVAAAPDGRRIALVAGGELYVAPVLWREDAFNVGAPQLLPTTPDDISGVGFLREDWLAFVGRTESESLLYEITVDGAVEDDLPNSSLGTPPRVDNFVAYPGNPTSSSERGDIMYEAEDWAWRYSSYGSRPDPVQAQDLYGVPTGEEAEEAEEPPGFPRAPFYMDY